MRLSSTLLLLVSSPLFAQVPVGFPAQSREPPLADERPVRVRGGYDPDESSDVRPAEHVVPAGPATLPGELLTTPVVIPAAYIEPAGQLPTPQVTLDVEGSDVSASGQTVVYKLTVRNVSRAKAHNVVVKVVPPKNVTKVKADPPPTEEDAETKWTFKTLEPNQTKTIELAYKPNAEEDEVTIQARVSFDFGRGMKTKVSPPALSVKKEGPEKVVVGDTVTYRITVSNTGRVTVRDIEVREKLNAGLDYDDRELSRGSVDGRLMSSVDRKSREATWTGFSLAPGQSKVIEYRVKAQGPGRTGSTVFVNAPGAPQKQGGLDIEVMTATLQMKAEAESAEKVSVGRPAEYKVTVENRGSADLRNVVVRCQFPPDMRVVRATNGGQPVRESVQWTFRELRPGDVKELNVRLETKSPGNRTIRFSARADKGAEQKAEVKTEFTGLPNLDWDVEGPGVGSVGKPITYRVTVSNRGTAAGKAELRVDLPATLDRLDTRPDAGSAVGPNAKEIRFNEAVIQAGKKATYEVRVTARSAGEAKAIFRLIDETGQEKKLDRVTNVTPSDSRSPAGPPPARGIDRSKVGASPRE